MKQAEVNTDDQTPLTSKIPSGEAGNTALVFVEAFAAKARQVGIRAIVMSELAKSLKVSKKTLYKYFPGKEDFVCELVVRWQSRIYPSIDFSGKNPIEDMHLWVDRWISNDGQYSNAFWRELRDDYPHLYQIYAESLTARLRTMRKIIEPFLREELNADFVFSAYLALVTQAARRKMFERLNMTKEECVHRALELWIAAVIDQEKIKKGLAEK